MPLTPMEWTRLEPVTRVAGLDGGLRAEVHDPLWLLARQWQLGELWGSDAGTPVQAVLRMDCTPVTRFAGGATAAVRADGTDGMKLSRVEPLEALVEREPVRATSATRLDLAVEAGLQLLRLVDPKGSRGYRRSLARDFPLQAPPGDSAFVGAAQRFVGLFSGRATDGTLLAWVTKVERGEVELTAAAEPLRARVSSALPRWRSWLAGLATAERSRVGSAVGEWLEWYDTLLAEPETESQEGAWLPERLEYTAAVSVPGPDGEVVLTIPEHHQGHLDWYSFDTVAGASLGATRADLDDWPWAEDEGERIARTVIPAPVSYPGMPASRYWEFEDARVDFGAVAAGAQQLAHLLLVEFALIYGDDWFIVPIDMPVGSLSRVRWLVVTDAFGGRAIVPSAREVDADASNGSPTWDMFRLAPDSRPVSPRSSAPPEGLFLPPTLGASLHGEALEEVLLLRDEAANMSWAVESVVEDPRGRPFDRAEAWHRSREAAPPPTVTDQTVFGYRLATDPPEHWLPLFPTRIDGDAPAIHYLRGGSPLGRILEPGRVPERTPLYIHDEEVPAEGARVTRAYQHARWLDGRTYVWAGRRKGVGRAQGSNGLSFDVLEKES